MRPGVAAGSGVTRRSRMAALTLALCAGAAAPPVRAQQGVERPGPYVVDMRGAMVGVPGGAAFYPVGAGAVNVPARGFGFEVGAHVYPLSTGPATVGLGVSVDRARGTVQGAAATITAVAPQVSFNFGSRSGWSTLSAGYGLAEVESAIGAASASSGRVGAINVGGGARWFLSSHLAVGFDVRVYRLRAGDSTPAATIVGGSAGFSLR